MQFKFETKGNSGLNKNLFLVLGNFWLKIHKYVFFVCLLLAIFLGLYIWRKSVTNTAWSEEKKQEYLNSLSRNVNLKEGDFEEALSDVKARKRGNLEESKEMRDIFKEY